MSGFSTKHSEIVNYWKDKFISSIGLIDTNEKTDDIKIIEDIGEPVCWACGKPFSKHDDSYKTWQELWDSKYIKSSLNRCHIIPRALCNNDEPHNLFLMCEICHHESPDTSNTKAFFRWVYDKRKTYSLGVRNPFSLLAEINNELERRHMPDFDTIANYLQINGLMPNFETDKMKEHLRQHVNSHGGRYNENSLIIGITDYLLSIYSPALYQ